MSLPDLVHLSNYEATKYIDAVYEIFLSDTVNGRLSFLGLPVTCPWKPPSGNKHFSFWHVMSTGGGVGTAEDDRLPDMRRCERIRWIAYTIRNASNPEMVWCWEKEVRTSRGRSKHILLYLHEQRYLVVLRRKQNRLELVTAYEKHGLEGMRIEAAKHPDPRNAEAA